MSNPSSAHAGSHRAGDPASGAGYGDASAQLARLTDDVGRLGLHTSQTMPTGLSMHSSGSSSLAQSPTARSYATYDAAMAAARKASAMPAKHAGPVFYESSVSSPVDGESSSDLPVSASFGGPGDTAGGTFRRHASHHHGGSTLAHKDSFGGLHGIQRSSPIGGYSKDAANTSGGTSASGGWRGLETPAADDSRQQLYGRSRQASTTMVEDSPPRRPDTASTFAGHGTFRADAHSDGPGTSSTSSGAEPVEVMGSVGGRSSAPRSSGGSNGGSNGSRSAGTSSGRHTSGRASSLSAAAAAAAAAAPSSSTATTVSGGAGNASESSAPGSTMAERPEQQQASSGNGPGIDSLNRAISRSQSLAAEIGSGSSATGVSARGRDSLSLPISALDAAAHAQASNGTSPTSALPLSPISQVSRASESLRPPSSKASAGDEESSRASPSPAAAVSAVAGPQEHREARSARAAGAPAQSSAARSETAPPARPSRAEPMARSGSRNAAVLSETKAPSATTSRDRPSRNDRDRAAAGGASTSGSARHGSSTGGTHHSSRTDASRGAKSASRTLPQLPSAPTVKPAPPPAMYWSKAPVHGSVPRRSFRAHTANLCDEVLWLFGGCDNKGCFRDLWCFDTETMCWSKPKVTGEVPPARRAHSATMVNQRLFVFAGGDGPNYFNDLYVFDTVSLRWSKPEIGGTPPSPRRAHTCNYHEGQLIVFGGGNGVGALNDVHALDVHDLSKLEWRRLECKGKIPIGRGYHTTNLVDGKLIVIGGSDGHMSFNDIHILRLDTRTWYQVKTDEIHNRLGHTATQVGSYLFVFGGHDSKTYTDELLTLNLVNLQWEPRRVCGAKPPGRGYHQAWLRDSRLFVHGGFDGKDIFDDLYYLDLAACAYLPQITSFTVELDDE
ncbi:uncharacterized protein PFL1_05523 [Pseudozyma flocculosa PF-1]|uniref:Tip elongation aberrant protein 1 n=1 Tax=Pseudozyma flocculosa PF-1 TaxID=1277687 RepID=A0A061H333_9BASI|nr:uncharacterized protein PFL1_05523 [Pseudozyma flocculosa PF-1]EPQ26888.1 hypothetical protein PFL1_05523 [Pseudozyma flocculosa PF-1]